MSRGPSQRLMASQRAPHDRVQLLDAEVIEQTALDLDHIGNGNGGKIAPIGFARLRIETTRSRTAATTAQQVRADHEKTLRIDHLAGAHHNVPPTGVVSI